MNTKESVGLQEHSRGHEEHRSPVLPHAVERAESQGLFLHLCYCKSPLTALPGSSTAAERSLSSTDKVKGRASWSLSPPLSIHNVEHTVLLFMIMTVVSLLWGFNINQKPTTLNKPRFKSVLHHYDLCSFAGLIHSVCPSANWK